MFTPDSAGRWSTTCNSTRCPLSSSCGCFWRVWYGHSHLRLITTQSNATSRHSHLAKRTGCSYLKLVEACHMRALTLRPSCKVGGVIRCLRVSSSHHPDSVSFDRMPCVKTRD